MHRLGSRGLTPVLAVTAAVGLYVARSLIRFVAEELLYEARRIAEVKHLKAVR